MATRCLGCYFRVALASIRFCQVADTLREFVSKGLLTDIDLSGTTPEEEIGFDLSVAQASCALSFDPPRAQEMWALQISPPRCWARQDLATASESRECFRQVANLTRSELLCFCTAAMLCCWTAAPYRIARSRNVGYVQGFGYSRSLVTACLCVCVCPRSSCGSMPDAPQQQAAECSDSTSI